MQKPTINQINGRTARNPTIQYSKALSDQYERYNGSNYRNRYFYFKTWFSERTSLTPAGNFIFGAAERELQRITGDFKYNYERDNRQVFFEIEFSGYTLQFQVRTRIDQAGVNMSVETNFKPIQDRKNDHLPYYQHHSHKVRSSSKFADLNIKEYFERVILKKYLFAPGLFRNIQIVRNCSKPEAIQWYKDFIKKSHQQEPDTYKAISHQIKKRLNIEVRDTFNEKFLLQYLKTEPRNKKNRKKLIKHPDIFELADDYCSQYDTDGHEETFLNEVYSDYPKNAIFI